MTDMFRPRKGFTLSELLVAAAILAILAGLAMPLAKIAIKREKEIELQRSLRLIREAIDEYKRLAEGKKFEVKEDTEGYPPDLETLVQGVKIKDESQGKQGTEKTVKFLRRIPKDPMTNSFDWGLRSFQDAFDSSEWGGENVYDVFSRSNKTAIDGTKYRDW
jgi:general secretion pathway protein G